MEPKQNHNSLRSIANKENMAIIRKIFFCLYLLEVIYNQTSYKAFKLGFYISKYMQSGKLK